MQILSAQIISGQIWSGDIKVIVKQILQCSFRMLDRKNKIFNKIVQV